MKKLFSFMLILFLGVGLFGLPAIPLYPVGDTPGLVMAQEDVPEVTPAVPASMVAVFLVRDQVPDLPGNEVPYSKNYRAYTLHAGAWIETTDKSS